MKKITELTAELAAPAIAEQGCTLWDVEYVKEAGTWYLRILLDKEGGVDILDLNIDGIALATVADSFAAIEQRVVEEKKLTWDRLFELLDTNYEGAERERLMLKNIRRFGSPGSRAQDWAVRIRDYYVAPVSYTHLTLPTILRV